MALNKELGYEVLVTFGGNKIAGTTQDSFTIAGKNEETIMKADNGVKQIDNIGTDASLSVNAYVMKGTDSGWMNVADVMQACATNTGLDFSLTFGGAGTNDAKVTGVAKFTSFTINSDSENYADMTVEIQVQGTPVVTHS